jgi:dGTPase
MLHREELEKRETSMLASYAVQSANSRGRAYPEEEHPYRSVFQRDKDRIIFSAAFRRLQYKTQVFTNFEGDYYRTRLTHTLEVSQIARSIARSLFLNEDLSEAIALAHDLGHGPFGHIGEQILDGFMKEHGGFEHNRQSYRVVEELEDIYTHGKGLNLTWETKDGLQKHNYDSPDDLMPISYTMLEAQAVDVADEIAYNCHDIDDGLWSHMFSEKDLEHIELWQTITEKVRAEHPRITHFQFVRLMIRYLIDAQVTDLLIASEKRIEINQIDSLDDVRNCPVQLIDFSDQMNEQIKALKKFLFQNFYRNERVVKIVDFAEECISGLFNIFLADPSKMPLHFFNKVKKDSEPAQRIVCDYIAGMTDRYAFDQFQILSKRR